MPVSFTEQSFQPLADEYGIPIVLIIEIIADFMQHCYDSKEEAVRKAKNLGPLQRALLRVKLHRQTELRGRQITKAVADAEDMLRSMSDERIEQIYVECNFYREI
jgi:hypothetical protein